MRSTRSTPPTADGRDQAEGEGHVLPEQRPVNWSIIDNKTAQANGATDAADAKTTDKAADWFNNNTDPALQDVPVRTGREGRPGAERSYWRTAPPFRRSICVDREAQVAAVQRGDIDLTRSCVHRRPPACRAIRPCRSRAAPSSRGTSFRHDARRGVDKAVVSPAGDPSRA
jgi:hypothetical protein